MRLADLIARIEQHRSSRVVVLAASRLDLELLPRLYDLLLGIGSAQRLDILCYCRGGEVVAARRIGLLFDRFATQLSFIVPDRCESAGTILALAGRELLPGPAAIFSPVDPQLEAGGAAGTDPMSVSAEDIRLFPAMLQDWLGLDAAQARQAALNSLSDAFFPATLTSFYRSVLETRFVCRELLALHMEPGQAQTVVDRLIFGFHSHIFPLNGDDLREAGLPVGADLTVDDLAWQAASQLRPSVGGGNRNSHEDEWWDAALITRDCGWWRRQRGNGLAPQWEQRTA